MTKDHNMGTFNDYAVGQGVLPSVRETIRVERKEATHITGAALPCGGDGQTDAWRAKDPDRVYC